MSDLESYLESEWGNVEDYLNTDQRMEYLSKKYDVHEGYIIVVAVRLLEEKEFAKAVEEDRKRLSEAMGGGTN